MTDIEMTCECCDSGDFAIERYGVLVCAECDNFECKQCGVENDETGYAIMWCKPLGECVCKDCAGKVCGCFIGKKETLCKYCNECTVCEGCDCEDEPCECNGSTDIRSRCDPILSAKQFSKCPMRVDTAYFHINNDYEKYKEIEASCNRREKYEKYFKIARDKPYNLRGKTLEQKITHLIEQDEKYESENLCYECGTFITLAD